MLEELPDPKPGPGEVLLAVKACGVNYPDVLIIEDKYQFKPPRPFAPGGEVAGVIEAVGPGVTGLKPGDRVIGSTISGGMAEKLVLEAGLCIAMPAAMPFDEASALVLTYGTSIYALKDRGTAEGRRDAAGAGRGRRRRPVGGRARQGLRRARDRRGVVARTSWRSPGSTAPTTASSTRRARSTRPAAKALADIFKKACGENGADVIYDPVGGDYSEAALRAIAWEGRFLVVGFPAGIAKLPLNLTLLKSCQVVGVFWGAFTRRDPKANAANIAELMQLYAKGAIKPVVSERYPLARAGEAIARLAARKAMGKIVVTME